MEFKNIIFDLGGVFINLDFSRTEQAFKDLGVKNFPDFFKLNYSSPLFAQLEIGKITPTEFYDGFRELVQLNLSDYQIKNAWNAMLLDFPPERLEWLDQIKKKYHIFLFSNTNQIHCDYFEDIFIKQTGKGGFSQYFIKAYYSQELGLRKPDKESYLAIMNEQNLSFADTVFIDDTLKNIEGAKEAGLQTIHLAPPMTVLDLGF